MSGASPTYDPGDGSPLAVRIVNRDGSPVAAGGGGGTSMVDDTAYTPTASSVNPVGGIVTSDTVDNGDVGAFKMLTNRQQLVTLADANGNEIPLGTTSTPTLSNVADAATSQTLLSANSGRKGAIVYNDSSEFLYLKYGGTASATSFTAKIAPSGYWEMPQPIYTGVIDGIWSADASGAARVTEL